MRQSADLNRIYWLFLSIFIMLIYTAIIFWGNAVEFYWKILVGGIFTLICTVLFAALRQSQETKELNEDQQIAKVLGQPFVQELPDGSKVHFDALLAPQISEHWFYCPKCKALKRSNEVWGDTLTNKLCVKCDTKTIPILNGKTIVCEHCQAPNEAWRNYCWKCQYVLPDVPKEKINEIVNITNKESKAKEAEQTVMSKPQSSPVDS